MGAKKTKNLSVAVGKYTDSNGTEKTNWKNIGSILQKDDGGKFMLLDRTFNPAGVPNPENKDMLIVGMFDVKDNNNGQGEPEPAPVAPVYDDSEIPF